MAKEAVPTLGRHGARVVRRGGTGGGAGATAKERSSGEEGWRQAGPRARRSGSAWTTLEFEPVQASGGRIWAIGFFTNF